MLKEKRVMAFYMLPHTENDNFNPKRIIILEENDIQQIEKKHKDCGKNVFEQLKLLCSFQLWVLEKRADSKKELLEQIDKWLESKIIYSKVFCMNAAHKMGYDFAMIPDSYFYIK